MEIAVPDGDGIKWEKIKSINVLDEQHVYDLAIEGTHNFIANDIIAHNTGKYFQYIAYLSTNNTNLTPMLQEVNASYNGLFTDSGGNYNYTLFAPSTAATYSVKVNATFANISGEALANLEVKNSQTINLAAGGAFIIQNASGSALAIWDSAGNLNIKGALTQNAEPTAGTRDFTIQNSTSGLNFVITNPEGNMRIKGYLNENQPSPLSPTLKSFIIQNKTGNVISYVNSTGSLFLTGTLTSSKISSS